MEKQSISINHALALHSQARRWAAHAVECGVRPGSAYTKALESLEFSLRRAAPRICVPSKLVGVLPHQDTVAGLSQEGHAPGRLLLLMEEDEKGRLCVFWGSEQLGRVQAKHVPWLRPVLSRARCHLLQCTGGGEKRRGVNIVFSFPRVEAPPPQFEEDAWLKMGGWEQ